MFWYWYGTVVAIAHIPIVIDLLRFVFPWMRLSRVGHWSRFIFLICAPVIFLIALWQALCVYIPIYEPYPLHTVTGLLHITLTLWIFLNGVVHYFRALLTPPGVEKDIQFLAEPINTCYSDSKGQFVGGDVHHRSGEQVKNGEVKRRSKPRHGMDWNPRHSNYCKICQMRVAYMDHHCPYIGSCLGLHNYSYFHIGVMYGIAAGIYGLLLSAPWFWECDIKYLLNYYNIVHFDGIDALVCEQLGTQSRAFLAAVFGLYMTVAMALCQNILLLADISTYTMLQNSSNVPIIQFIGERIRGGKYRDPDSILNVLILNQRPRWYYYIIPLKNYSARIDHYANGALVHSV